MDGGTSINILISKIDKLSRKITYSCKKSLGDLFFLIKVFFKLGNV